MGGASVVAEWGSLSMIEVRYDGGLLTSTIRGNGSAGTGAGRVGNGGRIRP